MQTDTHRRHRYRYTCAWEYTYICTHVYTQMHTHMLKVREHRAMYRSHRRARTWARTHIPVHISMQKRVERHTEPPTSVRRCTDTDAGVYPLRRTPIADAGTPSGPVYSPAHAPARARGAHLQAHGHACPRPPRSSWAPAPGRAPTPTYSSPWTVASGLAPGQGVGAGPAEAADGAGTRRGRGGWMTLDAWGRRALRGAALPPPWHGQLINLMN